MQDNDQPRDLWHLLVNGRIVATFPTQEQAEQAGRAQREPYAILWEQEAPEVLTLKGE